jgi:hypothetical protein
MSRSNPSENTNPNPATRRFEWNGEKGTVRYYDKEKKENVEVGSDFTFILLDQLGSVGGWHDPSDSGIYSNEVKDTRQEAMVVKAFKGGTLAEGIYQSIKDRVGALGGQFVAKLYIAFKNDGGTLAIGSLGLKGATLGAWMEFTKANRADLYKKSIRINGFTEGKKGRIVFRVPVLSLKDITPATDAQAVALDKELQAFFDGYFKRTKKEQAEGAAHHEAPVEEGYADNPATDEQIADLTDDDIPFAWMLPLLLPALGAFHAAAGVMA